jgi:REP element-mobilizing transposase RayT
MLGDWRSAKTYLFRDDKDRERLLNRLADRSEQYNIRVYFWVLMANHFHLVCETPQANLSAFMQSMLTAYTVYYNLRHGRHGHVFDGRYKAKLVEGDEYLLQLSRYVHLNPVCVGTRKNRSVEDRLAYLRSYQWSSFPGYTKKPKASDFVDHGPVLAQMGGRISERPKRYRKFVETGLAEDDEEFREILSASPRSIGGDDFRAWVDALHLERLRGCLRPEDISFRHTTEPLSPNVVLAVLANIFDAEESAFRERRRNSALRAVAARYLMRYAALSQREVADLLHAGSGSAISKQLKGYAKAFNEDRSLKRKCKQVDAKLESKQAEYTAASKKRKSE